MQKLPLSGARGKPWSPARRHHAWLATWLQDRRRSRVVAPEPPVTLLTGLVAYWNLDETDFSYGAADATANSIPALPLDYDLPTAVAGILGGGCDFHYTDGGWPERRLGSSDARLWLAEDFSVSVWVSRFGGDYAYCIYHTQDPYGYNGIASFTQFYVSEADGSVTFGLWWPPEHFGSGDPGYAYVRTGADCVPTDSSWHHLVAMREGTTLKLYVDGALGETVAMPGPLEVKGDTFVGSQTWGYDFHGVLDEIGFWNRALSAAEVEQLFNNGSALAYEWF